MRHSRLSIIMGAALLMGCGSEAPSGTTPPERDVPAVIDRDVNPNPSTDAQANPADAAIPEDASPPTDTVPPGSRFQDTNTICTLVRVDMIGGTTPPQNIHCEYPSDGTVIAYLNFIDISGRMHCANNRTCIPEEMGEDGDYDFLMCTEQVQMMMDGASRRVRYCEHRESSSPDPATATLVTSGVIRIYPMMQ